MIGQFRLGYRWFWSSRNNYNNCNFHIHLHQVIYLSSWSYHGLAVEKKIVLGHKYRDTVLWKYILTRALLSCSSHYVRLSLRAPLITCSSHRVFYKLPSVFFCLVWKMNSPVLIDVLRRFTNRYMISKILAGKWNSPSVEISIANGFHYMTHSIVPPTRNEYLRTFTRQIHNSSNSNDKYKPVSEWYLHIGPSGDYWTGTSLFAAKHLQPNYVKSIPLPSRDFNVDEFMEELPLKEIQKIYDTGELPLSIQHAILAANKET